MTWIAVALGGALGSLARHWVNLEMAHRFERAVPNASFGLDTFTLAYGGDYVRAFWNVTGQIALGLGALWLGFYLGA